LRRRRRCGLCARLDLRCEELGALSALLDELRTLPTLSSLVLCRCRAHRLLLVLPRLLR
jgi:hypothetical protein